MSNESVITDEMKGMIGMETKRTVLEVDKTMLSRIAEAVGDSNFRWQEEAAPGFLVASMVSGSGEIPDKLFPMKRRVDGGGEWEFLLPIKVGDTVTCITKLADLYEREGKSGTLLFLITGITVTNQRGELAAKSTGRMINY